MDAGNVARGALLIVIPSLQTNTKERILEELDEIFEAENPRSTSTAKTEICQCTIKNKHGGNSAEVWFNAYQRASDLAVGIHDREPGSWGGLRIYDTVELRYGPRRWHV